MRKLYKLLIILYFYSMPIFAMEATKQPWDDVYQQLLIEKAGTAVSTLAQYPSLIYPNEEYQNLFKKFPDGKVLVFGYGSLINKESAAKSVKPKTLKTIRPVIAFGLKRIFNYKPEGKTRWTDLQPMEKAMLNVSATSTYQSLINGIVLEADVEDLEKLVQREKGYDLVPVLVADWQEALQASPTIKIQIAYAFVASAELREGIQYTNCCYYPIRGYLNLVRDGSKEFGKPFLDFWNATTYLANGTTIITKWDEKQFTLLCSQPH